jgi:hypothetical protein
VRVPDLIFAADPVNQCRIGEQLLTEFEKALSKPCLCRREGSFRAGGGCVDHRARGRHEGQCSDGVVGVSLDGAAHPAGVIRDHAADRAGVRARGIRFQPSAVRRQQSVDMTEDHSGSCAHLPAVIIHLRAIPVATNVDQNVV